MSSDDDSRVWDAIDEHLALGDARAAVRDLSVVAGYPRPLTDGVRVATTLRRIAAGDDDLADLERAAGRLAEAPADLQVLYDAGYALFELGLFALAAAMFARAEVLSPGLAPVVSELCAALEEQGRHPDAVRLLQAHPQLVEGQVLFAYLLAFNAVLSGDLALARAQVPFLADPADANEAFMVDRVHRMLARADFLHPAVCSLDDHDLRGWHAVLTGGALLHLSPHGFAEAMRGRYAFVQDSAARIRAGIGQLQAALGAFALVPERVLLLPERGSEALGRATAAVLGLPTAPFSPEVRGLVVAYDLDHLPHPAQVALRQHRPGQHLWAHAVCWTTPPICVPDVATYLYQINVAPWEPQEHADGDAVPGLEGPAERLAEALLAATPDPEDARPGEGPPLWAHMAGATDAAEPALRRTDGVRERLWRGGPVPSSAFR